MFTAKKNIVRVSRRSLLAFLPVAVIFACGRTTNTDPNQSFSSTFSWKSKPVTDRISESEINQVYTTDTVVIDGKTFPFSKAPLKYVYNSETAPPEFLQEWGDFTAGTEVKGFLNLGYVSSTGFQERLIKNLESVSTWKSMKRGDGKELFADAYEVNDQGNKIDDKADGKAGVDGDLHKVKFVMNTPVGALPVPGSLTIYNRGGEIQADITNTEDLRVFPVGVILKKNGLNIHLKFYPHEKGWLVYGAAAAKLEKFKDAIKPEDLTKTVDSFYAWLKDRTILPL